MSAPDDTVFMFDCDNTLLDNDRVSHDLRAHLLDKFGQENCDRYWTIFEELRAELGYADYLGALQRYRLGNSSDTDLLSMSSFLIDYPFQDRLYPGAIEAIRRVAALGTVLILSDGDVVFQPRKIERSGLWSAVDGRVLIYIHKEGMLDDVAERFPARRYVMFDDKLRVLTAMKAAWGERVITVFPRQGHYALDGKIVAAYPPADVAIESIAEVAALDWATLVERAR